MQKKAPDNELLRLAIITLLISSMFGILYYFPEGETFDSVSMGAVLAVIARTMLYAPFPIFALYLISLGLNSRYKKRRSFPKLQAFLYDLGILLTVFIIFLASIFIFLFGF